MNMRRTAITSRTAPLIVLLVAPHAAHAQSQAEPGLEEIVITTARQRVESLQDVPASITAITSETLEAAAVERAGDFVRLTPGVSLVQAAEVADAQVNIRGINGARDAENSFALIIDGILQTNPAAFNREYSDLQQIEVVKGPQGAIYGRNAAAGAIIVTTGKPTRELSGGGKVSGGEDGTYTGELTLSGPLAERVSWKIQTDYRTTDGFYRNDFLGRDSVDDFEGWNVHARLLFEASEQTTLDVKAHYGEVEAAAISFNAAFALPTLASAFAVPALFENPNEHAFEFLPNIDPQNDQESLDLSAKLDHAYDWGTLTAWGLFSDVDNAFSADGTSGAFGFFFGDPTCIASWGQIFNSGLALTPPSVLFGPTPAAGGVLGPYSPLTCDGTQYQERNQRDYSFELRLTSRSDQRLRWLTGVYYLNIDRQVGVNTAIDSGVGVVPSLFIPRGQPNATEALVWDDFDSDVYAVFGSIDFDLSPTLELGLALRYDREEREVHNLVPPAARTTYLDTNPADGFTGNAPLNPALFPQINPSGVIPDKQRNFDQLQPKVSLTWEPTPDWTAYANWGIGFKSGGFNNQGSAATVDFYINSITGAGEPGNRSVLIRDEFDKEKSSASEIGVKANLFDRRLQLEAAVFNTDVDDLQFFEFLVGAFGLLRVVNTVDEVNLRGAEIGATMRLTDALRLTAGYSRVDGEIEANASRPRTVGNRPPYTPDYTAMAGLQLDLPLRAGDWRLQGGAFWNRTGPTWFHTVQNETNLTLFAAAFGPALGRGDYTLMRRDRYDTLDARIGVTNGRWTIAAVGKNVTDEEYLQEIIVAPEFGGAFIHPSGLRRWSLEVGYRF